MTKLGKRRSPYGLIQERVEEGELYGWRVLVASMLLNVTDAERAWPVIQQVLESWQTPEALAGAEPLAVEEVLRELGLKTKRAARLREMSAHFAAGFVTPRELPGVGDYGALCWQIFVEGEIPQIEPADPYLSAYWWWATRKDRPQGVTKRERSVRDPDVLDVLGAADAAGVTIKTVCRALEIGDLDGRWFPGKHGWRTTRRAVHEWMEDKTGSARRRQGETPSQIASWRARARKTPQQRNDKDGLYERSGKGRVEGQAQEDGRPTVEIARPENGVER